MRLRLRVSTPALGLLFSFFIFFPPWLLLLPPPPPHPAEPLSRFFVGVFSCVFYYKPPRHAPRRVTFSYRLFWLSPLSVMQGASCGLWWRVWQPAFGFLGAEPPALGNCTPAAVVVGPLTQLPMRAVPTGPCVQEWPSPQRTVVRSPSSYF